ncbi:ABC transporter substrate-binding protein [Alicyclobacillus sp. SO9]|uniref:ABC transporter substrate-binding protein n=1 Tax=Alicyclobacillus sp. SO9 TaxID=2665646 RepID=UPI0018E74928|nr:ABC transporter substrate-binding protein [Alicyclobacillus sp. SO9]QQE80090.1 ABC transporter substrate-binding protein [Alicyclobacillus sp. SO9]
MQRLGKKVKRGATVLGIGAVLTTALIGCGTSPSNNVSGGSNSVPSTGGAKPVTVRYSEVIRSIFYAPQYVAMAEGFFKQQGIKVDMVTSEGSNKGAAALLSGSADIALVGPETSVYIYNQHGGKTLKVFYQLTNTDGSFIMSHKKINNFKWSDLQGKSVISWRPGSAPQMVLAHDLKAKGVKANVITNIAPQAMVGAFESKKADFIQVYEPVASQLEQSGKAYYDTSVGQAIGNYPETAFEATSSYVKAHPKVIQEWTDAVYKATQWINSHSATQVAQAIKPYFTGTPVNLIAKSVDRYQKLNTWKTPVLSKAELTTLQNVLIASGTEKPNQRVKYSDVVDPSFAQKALNGK